MAAFFQSLSFKFLAFERTAALRICDTCDKACCRLFWGLNTLMIQASGSRLERPKASPWCRTSSSRQWFGQLEWYQKAWARGLWIGSIQCMRHSAACGMWFWAKLWQVWRSLAAREKLSQRMSTLRSASFGGFCLIPCRFFSLVLS